MPRPAFVCLLLVVPLLGGAPLTIDQVLAMHTEALGGIERLRAQTSRRTTSILSGLAPFGIPVVVEQTRKGLYRRTVDIQGTIQITAFDGAAGWKVDPFAQGSSAPEALTGEELKDLLEAADFDGDLVDPNSKGSTVVYLGERTVGERPAHALRLTLKNGRSSTIFLDASTFLEMKRVQVRPQMGQEVEMEILCGDWREVQGVRFPFDVTIRLHSAPQGLRVRVDRIDVNVPLEATRFRRPDQTGA